MALLVSLLFGFVPALLFAYFLYWLDRYEKEPKLLLGGVFMWGVVVAAGGAFIINTVLQIGMQLFVQDYLISDLAGGSLIAPLVEEVLKGLAVLAVFLVFRHEFDSVLDGIIYAGVAALGFAATENTYYIYNYGFLESGWTGLWNLVFVRVILVGWQHPFYTAFIGIGLALARLNRSWFIKILAPLAGFSLAMFTHGMHNTLAVFITGTLPGDIIFSALDWSGWFFMFLFILYVTWHERKLMHAHLWEEVQAGRIDQTQYRTASSAWVQMSARVAALFSGRYLKTARFYQVCGELAHKKNQLQRLGDEAGNQATIRRLQEELAGLAPLARAI
ncbi:MAG: PrsW family intramembrane metalloprotease [Chloroflexota bacterium]